MSKELLISHTKWGDMMKVLIYTNPQKDAGLIFTHKLASYLRSLGAEPYLSGAESSSIPSEHNSNIYGFVLSVGGDGTFLRAAKAAYGLDVPIAGINLGRLGFMPSLEMTDIDKKARANLSPKLCEVPACKALPSCIIASME